MTIASSTTEPTNAAPEAVLAAERDLDIDRAVEDAVAGLSGRFGGFHAPDIREGCLRVSRAITAADSSAIEHGPVLRSFAACLAAELDAVAIRALITRFVDQPEGQRSYRRFAAECATTKGRHAILYGYPELARLLGLMLDHVTAHAIKVLSDALQDAPLLNRTFGVSGPITEIRTGQGDRHHGGATVTFVTWLSGTAVHKPRGAQQSHFVEQLQACLDPSGTLFGPLLPQTIGSGETHSWQNLVRHEDLPDERAADEYYRRFGAAAALATALGATDLHYENVIATAGGPVILDVEAMASLSRTASQNASAAEKLSHNLDRGPLHTMLLPMRFLGAGIDMDISGLGTTHVNEHSRLTAVRVTAEGTDDIGFATIPATVGRGPNAATLNTVVIDPREYAEALAEGYQAGRARIEQQRADVQRLILQDAPPRTRAVIRPTYVYSRFLDASTHPVYLKDREDRRRLFDRLPAPRLLKSAPPAAVSAVRAEEVEALLDLDVPYFEIDADSPGLVATGARRSLTIARATSTTAKSEMLSSLESFLRRPPQLDQRDLRLSLISSTDDVWSSPLGHRQRPPIGPRILPEDEAMARSADGTALTWLSVITLGDGLRLAPVSLGLYEGGGELIAAARLGTDQDRDTVAAAVRGSHFHEVPPSPDPVHLSPFVGSLADHVTVHELSLDRAAPWAPAPLPAQYAHLIAEADPDALDYLGGLGAYFVGLSRYQHTGLDAMRLRQAAHAYLDLHGASLSDWSKPGLAHGTTGRIAAFNAISTLLGGDGRIDDALLTAIQTFNPSADDLVDTASNVSWCRGYAGILPTLADVGSRLSEHVAGASWFNTALDLLAHPEEASEHDVSLCHGGAGRVMALLDLANQLDRPELGDQARAARDATQAKVDAGAWRSGLGRAPELTSFMLGTSGWLLASAAVDAPAVFPSLLVCGR